MKLMPALAHVALATAAGALCLAPSAMATFPGTNGKIVFERSGSIFGMPLGEQPLQLSPSGLSGDLPAVSPDGNLVAFARVAGSPPGYGIWTVSTNGGGARQVTTDPQSVAQFDTDPAWSPDGSRIAFIRNGDLHVMNADGSATTNLTPDFVPTISDPDWSPDGSRIAFAASNQIYTIGAGGTPGPTQLNPTAPGNRGNPSWSPDGSRIAYARGPGASPSAGVWTINANGTGEGPLIANLNEVWEVAWSPDGTRIGLIRDAGRPAQEELWVVGADGSGLTPLNVDTDVAMDWGPQGTQPPPAEVPPPVLGRAVNVEVVSGRVLVAVPRGGSTTPGQARASQKGLRFVPLTADRQIPVGSFLNTRRGTVRLTSAAGRGTKTQAARFSAGLFQVLQSRRRRAKGLTELRLKGSSFRRCRTRRGGQRSGARAARLSRRTIRRLRGRGRGRFRTKARYSAGLVRGTVWITADRCDGTLTTVKRGKVAVRDFRRHKTVTVRAGHSYLARARP
jgi:hypothetical protein